MELAPGAPQRQNWNQNPHINCQKQELIRVTGPAQGSSGTQLKPETWAIQQKPGTLGDQVQTPFRGHRAGSPQRHYLRGGTEPWTSSHRIH